MNASANLVLVKINPARVSCPLVFMFDTQGRCLLLLLRIRSAHLEILGFPLGGVYLYRDIFARFKTMRRKQKLSSALGIKKKNGGNHAFLRDNKASIWKKSPMHCFVFYYFFELLLLNYL